MKRLILVSIFITAQLLNPKLNPLPSHVFSELMFDSTGWKLEIMGYADSLGLRLKSSSSTIWLDDSLFCEPYEPIVLTSEFLKDSFYINPEGDSLSLILPDGMRIAELEFGDNTRNPAPPLNSSLCYGFSQGKFYLDYSPTIGLPNDTLDGTGTLQGYVFDSNGNGVQNIKVWNYLDQSKINLTDSTGFYQFPSVLSGHTAVWISEVEGYASASTSILPRQLVNLDIHLPWVVDIEDEELFPDKFLLRQNFPNPFNAETVIEFYVPSSNHISIKLFDELGREIKVLYDDFTGKGEYNIKLNTSSLSSGSYFYTMTAGEFKETKKLILLK